jgi:hypothetical protein
LSGTCCGYSESWPCKRYRRCFGEAAGDAGSDKIGKDRRCGSARGRKFQLVELVSDKGLEQGSVVSDKFDEILAVSQVLVHGDLHRVLIKTKDLLIQRALAKQIRA